QFFQARCSAVACWLTGDARDASEYVHHTARYRPSVEAAGTDRGDMAMIGAAAASDQLQIGQRWQQFRVIVGELGDIADIDPRRCSELGAALDRGARNPPIRPTHCAPLFSSRAK